MFQLANSIFHCKGEINEHSGHRHPLAVNQFINFNIKCNRDKPNRIDPNRRQTHPSMDAQLGHVHKDFVIAF